MKNIDLKKIYKKPYIIIFYNLNSQSFIVFYKNLRIFKNN